MMRTANTPYHVLFDRWMVVSLGREPDALMDLRKQAFSMFEQAGIPTRKSEEWKYTPLRELTASSFEPVWQPTRVPTLSNDLLQERLGSLAEVATPYRMVVVNGYVQESLSRLPDWGNDGFAGSWRTALRHPRWADFLLQQWGQLLDFRNENPYDRLNQAMAQDGALFVVPEGIQQQEPIHLVVVALPGQEASWFQPRHLVVAGERSHLRLIETNIAWEEGAYWTNTASSFVLQAEAQVEYSKIQQEHAEAWHLAQVQTKLAKGSTFRSYLFSLGAKVSRHEIEALLHGEQAHCDLNGLYLPQTQQHIENRICMEHAAPHCTSNQYYKGILSDMGKGVFNGKIHVRPKAQKTDAYQTNQALLLSDSAEIYTKPQLEIFADDVKCSHGATTGYLDENAMFYLRSRGLSQAQAETMLTYAFADDVVQRVSHESLRRWLEHQLQQRLHVTL